MKFAAEVGFQTIPTLFNTSAAQLPTDVEETYRFLLTFPSSQCKLDEAANEDYERTLNAVKEPPKRRIRLRLFDG